LPSNLLRKKSSLFIKRPNNSVCELFEVNLVNPHAQYTVRVCNLMERDNKMGKPVESRIMLIIIGCAVVFLLFFSILFYHSTLEDSFISFRYAKHLSSEHRIGVWNYNESPVEGYTSTLWILILGFGNMLGISSESLSKLIGLFSFVAMLFLLIKFSYFAKDNLPEYNWKQIGISSALILAFYTPISWYSVSGMETIFFSFLLLLFVCFSLKLFGKLKYTDLVFGILLIFTRPEGIAIVILLYIGILIQLILEKRPFKIIIVKIFCVGAFQLGFVLWRWSYYGYLLPNTYYAKVAGGGIDHFQLGLQYLNRALITGGYWLLLIPATYVFVLFILYRKIPIIIISWSITIIFYFLYIMKSGGDNWFAFPYYRHLVHIFPLLILNFSYSLSLILQKKNLTLIFISIVVVGLLNRSPVRYPGPILQELEGFNNSQCKFKIYNYLQHDPPSEYIAWIRDNFSQDTKIAVTLGGALPYFTDFYSIDMLGLSDTYIAHHGVFQAGAVDTKTDMDYVLKQKPDLIETTINANSILQNIPYLHKNHIREDMENKLVNNNIFKNDYLFIKNARYDKFPRALFINQKFYQQIKNKDNLEVVEVIKTSLYAD